MIVKESALTTKTVFSDDGKKLFLLQKSWSSELPRLCVIMLCAGTATDYTLDTTNLLVLNNSAALGFGTVDVQPVQHDRRLFTKASRGRGS